MELTDDEKKLAYHSLMLKACRKRQQIRNIQRRVAEGIYTTDDEIEIEKRIHLRELQATKADILAKKIIKGVEHLIEEPNFMTKRKVSTEDENPALRKGAVSDSFVAYWTFSVEAVNEMLKAERSIVKDGFVKISIDEEYKCSDADLAKYKIEYEYPLHLIYLGQDMHRAELKLSDELKRKWAVR